MSCAVRTEPAQIAFSCGSLEVNDPESGGSGRSARKSERAHRPTQDVPQTHPLVLLLEGASVEMRPGTFRQTKGSRLIA